MLKIIGTQLGSYKPESLPRGEFSFSTSTANGEGSSRGDMSSISNVDITSLNPLDLSTLERAFLQWKSPSGIRYPITGSLAYEAFPNRRGVRTDTIPNDLELGLWEFVTTNDPDNAIADEGGTIAPADTVVRTYNVTPGLVSYPTTYWSREPALSRYPFVDGKTTITFSAVPDPNMGWQTFSFLNPISSTTVTVNNPHPLEFLIEFTQQGTFAIQGGEFTGQAGGYPTAQSIHDAFVTIGDLPTVTWEFADEGNANAKQINNPDGTTTLTVENTAIAHVEKIIPLENGKTYEYELVTSSVTGNVNQTIASEYTKYYYGGGAGIINYDTNEYTTKPLVQGTSKLTITGSDRLSQNDAVAAIEFEDAGSVTITSYKLEEKA